MLYDHTNAHGATVHDIEAAEKIQKVNSVDTDAGIVTAFHWPLRRTAGGDEMETYEVRFATIHPIYGGGKRPCMFHCYGRVA